MREGSVNRSAWRMASVYVVVAGAWIALSDGLLAIAVKDLVWRERWSVAKGWGFVAVTGVVLYTMLRRAGRRAEREAAERKRWADAFEHCTHGIALGSPGDQHIVVCNPAYARMHGYAAEEVTGRAVMTFCAEEERPRVAELLAAAKRRRAPRLRYEARRCRKDGTIFPAEIDVVTVRDDAGAALYSVATIQDIADRAAAQAALRESEERFRALVESIREIFWMVEVGPPRRLLYVSPNYDSLWGQPRSELERDPMHWLGAVHAEDRDRVEAAVREKQGRGGYDEEYRIVHGDGSIRWIREQSFLVQGGGDAPARIVGVAEDITDRKSLEAQFLRAQRMEAIGTLAGGIAHDLNNILAPMLMAAGLLKENVTAARDREMLGMMEASARRGAEIIRQLLTFSRGLGGERGPIDLRHVLKEMGAMIRETFPREIQLVDRLAEPLPVVGDATQLHQVFVNLCVNARDAMPAGGVLTLSARQIDVTEQIHPSAQTGPYVIVTVADTGSGMSPAVMERIFDPFFTTKEVGKGTGLGLSTTLGIVRSHGGFLRVESTPGKGSSFHVYLPASAAQKPTGHVGLSATSTPGNGETILVVDDEASIRNACRQVLEKQGYRVLTAGDGREAVTRFLKDRKEIKVVLTDMMMPEMGGAALVRALLLIDPHVRIVATSGLDPDGNRDELAVLGVTEVLSKPCGPKDLIDAIGRALTA
ncbi:MAG TPA: PAS domain S-box protein [Opitutus sp.]|nr:PAS domain S-box protein [Opitutus sp.]